MRNPRSDPQKGDVLEHADGERRIVTSRAADGAVHYADQRYNLASSCSIEEWRTWAKQTSILGFGAANGR